MYVCVCSGVTEKQIAAAVQEGARCIKDLRGTLKVSAVCGRCTSCARQCLQNNMPAQSTTRIFSIFKVREA